MATNYRKNLILNPKGSDNTKEWASTGSVSVISASTPYFSIGSGGSITQRLKLPRIYPSAFHLKAQMVEPTNTDKGKPKLFFICTFNYLDIETKAVVRDVVNIPATSPLFQDERNYNGLKWNRIVTNTQLREMASEDTGFSLQWVEVKVVNRGSGTGYVTLMEAYPSNATAPMEGDGEEVGEVGELQPDGTIRYTHPSGSYIQLGHDIRIHAIGEIFFEYEGGES